jgi:hypothetical protein
MGSFAFEAKCVVTKHPDGECHFVGFADQKFDTRFYLMLERAFEHDEQDIQHGMDTFHIEWCKQENSGYGGISQFVLKPNIAEITFEQEASEEIGGLKHLFISFELAPAEQFALRDALGHIFSGTGCLHLVDA